MSDADRDAIIGRTLREYKIAKEDLAALHAESERIGDYLTTVGHALRTHHSLSSGVFGSYGGTVEGEKWPGFEQLNKLATEIMMTQANKKRLGELLRQSGHPQEE